jgi:hypothetical protein
MSTVYYMYADNVFVAGSPPPTGAVPVTRRWEEQIKAGATKQFTEDMAKRGITADTYEHLVEIVVNRLKEHMYVVLPAPQDELIAACVKYKDYQGSLGSITNYHTTLRPSEVFSELFNRRLPVYPPVDPTATPTHRLRAVFPTDEWKRACYEYREIQNDEVKDTLRSYISYGFSHMNYRLRKAGAAGAASADTALNSALKNAPITDKDMYVYRYITGMAAASSPSPGIHPSYGYLSTTYSTEYIAKVAYDNAAKNLNHNEAFFLKIFVPTGTHCLWVAGHEYEIIFPHGIQLEYSPVRSDVLTCDDDDRAYVSVRMYDVKIVG